MYSNLYKRGATVVSREDARIIDSNALMEKRFGGFCEGLNADVLEVVPSYEQEGEATEEAPDREAEETAFTASLEHMKEKALLEIEEMKQKAEAELAYEKQQVLAEAEKQGYADGYEKARRETDALKRELEEERKCLQQAYDDEIDRLEPQFVDTLTSIYEHIFNVEFARYRGVILHLLSTTLRKIEGSGNFIVHVSREDYPEAAAGKDFLMDGLLKGNAHMEIVADMTLARGHALIEADGGIFDCSLGTELKRLRRKLMLLAYEKPVEE